MEFSELASFRKLRRLLIAPSAERPTTVFPCQGHYALDADNRSAYPPADLEVNRIGELLDFDFARMFERAKADL